MTQSKRGSMVEALTNTGVGFGISLVTWHVVGPLMGYHVTIQDNLVISMIFTVVSIVRGYLLRRLFNCFH